ncbi:hypothetical protein K502DRAFT_348501 [Neoconidiobolus thromboides FSU 785]|nr:hypothetical protein K502DRAFT_348501 [Neoconidiobolus thromboides FSU 785]
MPIGTNVGSWYAYKVLGWPAIIEVVMTLLIVSIKYFVAILWEKIQTKLIESSDNRLGVANGFFQGIRIISFFAWGTQFNEKASLARKAELKVLIKHMGLGSLIRSFDGDALTPKIAFTSLLIFKSLDESVSDLSNVVDAVLQAKVSSSNDPIIGSKSTKLQYDSSEESNQFTLPNLNLLFPIDKLSIIVGPTGSGKTSLLSKSVYLPRKLNIKSTTCTKDFSLNASIA